MNKDIGLNSDLKVARRKFHLQSSYLPDNASIHVSLFDGGRMVSDNEFFLEEDLPQNEIQAQMSKYHDIVQSDIELLFSVVDKVRSKKLIMPITSLAIMFYERGFFQEALEQFKYARKLDPDAFSSFFEFGKTHYALGHYKEALEQFEYAVTLCSDYADIYYFLAMTQWKLENFAAAIHAFRRAIELNENYADAIFQFAYQYVSSIKDTPVHPELPPSIERLKEADCLLQRLLELQSERYDAELLYSALEIVNETDQTDETLDFLDQSKQAVVQGKSRNFERDFYIKFMYGELDTDEKSLNFYIEKLQYLLKKHPEYKDLHQSLGIAFLIKGWQCFGKSTEEFRKAVEMNDDYTKAIKNLKLMQNDGRGLLILLRAILG